MNAGWLVLAIALLLTGASCMIGTLFEVAMGKSSVASAAGAIVFHAAVGLFGIWILSVAAS